MSNSPSPLDDHYVRFAGRSAASTMAHRFGVVREAKDLRIQHPEHELR